MIRVQSGALHFRTFSVVNTQVLMLLMVLNDAGRYAQGGVPDAPIPNNELTTCGID